VLGKVRAERCRRSLAQFVRHAWPVLEPGTPLVWNWHLDAVCDHLQAVTEQRSNRLLINIPPGHGKSLLVAVFSPAWSLAPQPGVAWPVPRYALTLAIRDSVRCRDLILSDWYQRTFTPEWKLKGDQNVKSYFENTATGYRMSLSVGSQATALIGGDAVVVDDPINATEASPTWPAQGRALVGRGDVRPAQ